jgi:hypothetical protein
MFRGAWLPRPPQTREERRRRCVDYSISFMVCKGEIAAMAQKMLFTTFYFFLETLGGVQASIFPATGILRESDLLKHPTGGGAGASLPP